MVRLRGDVAWRFPDKEQLMQYYVEMVEEADEEQAAAEFAPTAHSRTIDKGANEPSIDQTNISANFSANAATVIEPLG